MSTLVPWVTSLPHTKLLSNQMPPRGHLSSQAMNCQQKAAWLLFKLGAPVHTLNSLRVEWGSKASPCVFPTDPFKQHEWECLSISTPLPGQCHSWFPSTATVCLTGETEKNRVFLQWSDHLCCYCCSLFIMEYGELSVMIQLHSKCLASSNNVFVKSRIKR